MLCDLLSQPPSVLQHAFLDDVGDPLANDAGFVFALGLDLLLVDDPNVLDEIGAELKTVGYPGAVRW